MIAQPTNKGEVMNALGMPTNEHEYNDRVIRMTKIIHDQVSDLEKKDKDIAKLKSEILKLKRKVARKNQELKKERTQK
mgnify:CR=1 FL=1|tara:strand:+ start:950 stop:1183 length:234 start_codon:yes stop_codon:yes gene_type:complete